eukprot:TRINITY_DN58609_c0_g1_i2.p1 TRINITY_DN58609_c0_g1~~TRINITY_DN58609_c0_g1_i2.p1  ORF type:complete len:904 (+),score=237.11 TRINITY_DN58609_c0_g1_i2:100-2811(+)
MAEAEEPGESASASESLGGSKRMSADETQDGSKGVSEAAAEGVEVNAEEAGNDAGASVPAEEAEPEELPRTSQSSSQAPETAVVEENVATRSLPGGDNHLRMLKKKEKKPAGHNIAMAFEIYPPEEQRLDILNRTVVRIQAFWRGFNVRKETTPTLKKRARARMLLQSLARGAKARRTAKLRVRALKTLQGGLRTIRQRRVVRCAKREEIAQLRRSRRNPKQLLHDAFITAAKAAGLREVVGIEAARINVAEFSVSRKELCKICAADIDIIDVFGLPSELVVTPLCGCRDYLDNLLTHAGDEAGNITWDQFHAFYIGRVASLVGISSEMIQQATGRLRQVFDLVGGSAESARAGKAEVTRVCGSDRMIAELFAIPDSLPLNPLEGTREVFDQILQVSVTSLPISWDEFYQMYAYPSVGTGKMRSAESVATEIKALMESVAAAWEHGSIQNSIQNMLFQAFGDVDQKVAELANQNKAEREAEELLQQARQELAKLEHIRNLSADPVQWVMPERDEDHDGMFDLEDEGRVVTKETLKRRKTLKHGNSSKRSAPAPMQLAVQVAQLQAGNHRPVLPVMRQLVEEDLKHVRKYHSHIAKTSAGIAALKSTLYEADRDDVDRDDDDATTEELLFTAAETLRGLICGPLEAAAQIQEGAEGRVQRHPMMIGQLRSCNETLDWLISTRLDSAVALTGSRRREISMIRDDVEDLEGDIGELLAEARERKEIAEHEEALRMERMEAGSSTSAAEALQEEAICSEGVDALLDAFTSMLAPLKLKLRATPPDQLSEAESAVLQHLEEKLAGARRNTLEQFLEYFALEGLPPPTPAEVKILQQLVDLFKGSEDAEVDVLLEVLMDELVPGADDAPRQVMSRSDMITTALLRTTHMRPLGRPCARASLASGHRTVC